MSRSSPSRGRLLVDFLDTDIISFLPMNVIPVGTFQLEPIPASARQILSELVARSKELAEKVEQRAPLGEYWVPALRSKDLGLALLNDHLNEIPSGSG